MWPYDLSTMRQHLVTLDLEGVLTPEIWIAVAERSGIDGLRRTTRDEPDYDRLMRGRLELLEASGLTMSQIVDVIDSLCVLDGARQFLDEEWHALGPVVHRERERGRQRLAQKLGGQRGSGVGIERLERQLAQRPAAAQLVAQAAQRMRARDLVGAIGPHHEDRELAQRIGERPEQLQGGVVGPLQIVEEDHGRGACGNRRQRAAQRLEQRGAIALGDRRPELGQQQREVPLQRAARGQRTGRCAQVAAQRAQHRPVGQRRRRARGSPQRQCIARRRDLLGQARLADLGGTTYFLGAVASATTASARASQPSIRSSSDMPRTSRW